MVEDQGISDAWAHDSCGLQRISRGELLRPGPIHDAMGWKALRGEIGKKARLAVGKVFIHRVQVNLHREHRHLLPWEKLCTIIMGSEMPAAEVPHEAPMVREASQA